MEMKTYVSDVSNDRFFENPGHANSTQMTNIWNLIVGVVDVESTIVCVHYFLLRRSAIACVRDFI